MTNEQRKAMDELNKDKKCSLDYEGYITIVRVANLDTVLSLMKEQDKQIENTTENYKNLIADVSMLAKELGLEDDATIDEIYIAIKTLKQKDKQIDLMAEYMSKQDIEEDICMKNRINADLCNENYTNCKGCIEQYFERKAINNV